MKKTAKKLLSLFLAAAVVFGAAGIFGIEFEEFGLKAEAGGDVDPEYDSFAYGDYNVNIIDGNASISYTGSAEKVVIPSDIDGYEVTEIASFKNDKLTEVVIPDTVTHISYSAFHCEKLEKITIPDTLIEINYAAFKDTAYYNNPDNWENGFLYIGKHLVSANENIGSNPRIKDGTLTIGQYVLAREIYDGNIVNGDYIEEVITLEIPDSVKLIGNSAFSGCTALADIDIPDGVEKLGSNLISGTAYYNDAENWENDILYVGKHLIIGKYSWSNPMTGGVDIKAGTKTIADYAFHAFGKITSVNIPDSVTYIGDRAFYGCDELTSVNIPASVTYIGDSAFWGCGKVTDFSIPSSVTTIGSHAFDGCDGITEISIPKNVVKIGEAPFADCVNLTRIVVDSSNKQYCSDSNGALYTSDGKKLIQYPAGHTATSYTVKNGTKRICGYAFSGASNLTSISIPEGVVSIDCYAFYETGITSMVIPNSVVLLGKFAFASTPVSSVSLSENLTKLENNLFGGCDSLVNITIPDSITVIDNEVFYHCDKLKHITIPDNVKKIGWTAFGYCAALESVDLPDAITALPAGLFSDCTSLKSIEIPATVTEIGGGAFENCTSLESIEIPEGVETLESGILSYCTSLKNVILHEGLKTINWHAFRECESLTSVVIPDGVESIGFNAFGYCDSLSFVHIPASVTEMYNWYGTSFTNCSPVICSDTADCYAKTYAEEVGLEFKVCDGHGASEPHVHDYSPAVTTEAGCETAGVITYSCSCGDYYFTIIAATGHSFGEWQTEKEATASEDGVKVRTCSACGKTEEKHYKASFFERIGYYILSGFDWILKMIIDFVNYITEIIEGVNL